MKLPDWSNPSIFQWQYIEDFPKWGGNNFRLFIEAFRDGTPLLLGQPLTLRVAESLKRFTTVIDWALQHNVYVIINFNPYSSFPLPGGNWPDDGRSLSKDASAQDELLQAWADVEHYKGRRGSFSISLMSLMASRQTRSPETTRYQKRVGTLFTRA